VAIDRHVGHEKGRGSVEFGYRDQVKIGPSGGPRRMVALIERCAAYWNGCC
jgi:hypothetical protein